MVNLDIYSFCENCPRFKAKSTTSTAYGDNELLWVDTNVTCEHSEFCGNLYNYLKKIFENKFYGSCKCQPPEGVIIKPDGVNELDPCVYEVVETHKNVTVHVLKCKKCGHIELEWSKDDEAIYQTKAALGMGESATDDETVDKAVEKNLRYDERGNIEDI